MRIAIFTNNYLPNPYGAALSVETFRQSLTEQGHRVFVFAPRWQGYVDRAPDVYRYPSIDVAVKIRFPLPLWYSRAINKVLLREKIDVIHAQHPNLLGFAAKRWARKKNIPLVFTWHALYDHYVHFAPFVPEGIAKKGIMTNAVRYANCADHLIVPTPSVEDIARQWGVTNKHVSAVPTGIVAHDFSQTNGERVRNTLGIPQDAPLLLTTTRLTEEKNVRFLIEALCTVLKNNAQAHYIVVGGGRLLSELQQRTAQENIADRLHFVGVITHDKIADYYAAADLFVFSSESETQGMSVTEALFMGLPTVAVDGPGVRDVVAHNETGLLVEKNKNAFVAAVQRLLDDTNLCTSFSTAAKQRAQQEFTTEESTKKLLRVYNDVLSRKS